MDAVLAQAAAADVATFIDVVAQGGAIAVLSFIVVAFLRGWIVPQSVHDRVIEDLTKEEARSDRMSDKLNAQNVAMREQVVPALVRATVAMDRRIEPRPASQDGGP